MEEGREGTGGERRGGKGGSGGTDARTCSVFPVNNVCVGPCSGSDVAPQSVRQLLIQFLESF